MDSQSWIEFWKMIVTRSIVLIIVLYGSFILPNINILLTFCGSVLGFALTILIPVIFYNAAYSETKSRSRGEVESAEYQKKITRRRVVIKINYFVLLTGFVVSALGFVDVVKELVDGDYST